MSRPSPSGFMRNRKVDTWLRSQAGSSGESLGDNDSSPSPPTQGHSHSSRDSHGPPFTTPPPSPLRIDMQTRPSDKVDTPTEPNSPAPYNATQLRELLKRIPADQLSEIFNEKLTFQISLGEILSRWSRGNSIMNVAGVATSDPVSSHPTTDTLGSQINNPFLCSVSSLMAAELTFKYPDPRAALRDMDKIEDPRWLRPAEPAPLPPLSEGTGASRPPSYGDPTLGSASTRNLSLPEDGALLSKAEAGSQTEHIGWAVIEFTAIMEHFTNEEVAETIRVLSTFNPEDYPTHNIEALKTARNQALTILGSSPRSVLNAMSDVHPDAWALYSPEWKRKWDSNLKILLSSMNAIRKDFAVMPDWVTRSSKSQARHIRHLTTHLEDEMDEIEARVGSFMRLFLTLQAKYLAKQLREVKEALRKSREEAVGGIEHDEIP